MRAPTTNKRSTDEIVAEIMKFVGCPEVEVYVRKLIDHLRTKPPPFSGNRKENVERAKDLRKRMKKLERMLKAPQSQFLGDRFWSVFWSPLYMPGDVIELNPQTRTYIAQESPRLKHFAEELSFFSSRCDQIIKLKLGQHGAVKYQQRLAVSASRAILREAASYTGTEVRLTVSPTGKLSLIASLFFEAATGKYDADLRQACKAVLNAKT